ncbi:hypothetical protein [Herbaspirillum sp. SJZ107]|uniref:hypothetical protein n=1 Tax=Herbaspirillum sp. SJZ107 TaxID=2572881 RepID=UPI0011506E71|nr:hypothetical protein [Herbaspirillum sp. SJZ107]TQK11852.1 hypothetical protein FBX97_1801 [Herbaspirillum sp. SJZ107]
MKTAEKCALAVAVMCAAGMSRAEEAPVPIRVMVQQLDLGTPVPLARVSGFTIFRNDKPYASAVCPDASDAKGELTCMLTCAPANRNATLLLMPPRREIAIVVAGMKVPAAREVKVADCRIATPQPVVVVYKTVKAQLAELEASSPAVYQAATTVVNGAVQLKPFSVASTALEQLAMHVKNRAAIQELGELSRLASERLAVERMGGALTGGQRMGIGRPSADSWSGRSAGSALGGIGSVAGSGLFGSRGSGHVDGPPAGREAFSLGPDIGDYAVGTRSILLKAHTADIVGYDTAGAIVKLSPSPTDLNESIENVKKTLGVKAVANKDEAELERAIKEMRSSY